MPSRSRWCVEIGNYQTSVRRRCSLAVLDLRLRETPGKSHLGRRRNFEQLGVLMHEPAARLSDPESLACHRVIQLWEVKLGCDLLASVAAWGWRRSNRARRRANAAEVCI